MRPKNNEDVVYQAVLAGELEIDEEGRVWRLACRRGDRWKGGTRLIPCVRRRAENDTGEYLQVGVMFGGKECNALAQRLVWRHFKGRIPDGLTVNHMDGKKKRNVLSNLELATYSEQQIHALRVLKVGRTDQNGIKNAMAKLTVIQVEEIRRRRARGERLLSIAQDFGIQYQTVSKIARGDRWAFRK